MTTISNQLCEVVSECVKLATSAEKPFWDLKAILAAIGISIALIWNAVQYFSGRSRRKRDQQWEMFRDEIYSPFLELLSSFEQQVRPAQLSVRLSGLSSDELSETIGDFYATFSEMELFCERADKHDYTSHSVFSETFEKCSNELNVCIGKLLTSRTHETIKFEAVSEAYRKVIEELRTCLSKCRKDLH